MLFRSRQQEHAAAGEGEDGYRPDSVGVSIVRAVSGACVEGIWTTAIGPTRAARSLRFCMLFFAPATSGGKSEHPSISLGFLFLLMPWVTEAIFRTRMSN